MLVGVKKSVPRIWGESISVPAFRVCRSALLCRDIGNALFNIERAVLGPAGSRAMWLDNDALALLLGGVLKSANRAVFDKEQNPPVEVEQVSVILQLTVYYILDLGRTGTIPGARRQLLIEMLKVFQETGLRLVGGKR